MSAPSPKRIRLSSPTFDDQVAELSQDDIDAFDSLDAQLSQPVAGTSRLPVGAPFRPQTVRIHAPFVKASAFEPSDGAEPPDGAPPEVDHTAWFSSDSSHLFVGFNTATTAIPGFQRPSAKGDGAESLFVPSAAALREAEAKMKKWQEEALSDQPSSHDEPDSHPLSPTRPTFSSARSAYTVQAPETPTPASLFRSADAELTPSKSHSSLQSLGGKRQTRPFKSPLISAKPSQPPLSAPNVNSPLHSSIVPTQSTPAVSPLRPSSVANLASIHKPLGFTPRNAVARIKFVTPFKTVAKAATPRASVPENIKPTPVPSNLRMIANRVYPPSVLTPQPSQRTSGGRTFDLIPPPGRRTLVASGLRPQAYNAKQLEDIGINFKELSQVNPRTAPFYAFTTRSRSPPNLPDSSSSLSLGRLAVLEELHTKGCKLAEQAWVDNHWPLILWKLAGMVALDPMVESDPLRKRWCWPEVIRQFMYRYERDLNSSSRPPLRSITTRDASAESPMIFCISDIIWPTGRFEEHAPIRTHPELEVTDGWYRLRARIDAPLARAVRKGKITIGRKIAVAGAKLSAERKEGSEIMEAYNSSVLLLSGNSTHMAPWHAKLGFQRGPFVATLNSLTADGGYVAVMLFTVIKAYPVAYIEFVQDAEGRKERVGPHDAKEELKLSTQWKTKQESHASRLWSDYEKRRCRLLDYAECLEQRAGSKLPRHDDGPPDKIYDIYDTLQEDIEATKSVISSIGHEDAAWLARHIRDRAVQERDVVSREIEQELESICPPRNVKAFCVIVVNDARTYKYPPKRTAQVTVWDVPGVSLSEGCTQSPFTPGQQYLVTNLVPSQASAWMDRFGEVYLSTRKNSRWTLIK